MNIAKLKVFTLTCALLSGASAATAQEASQTAASVKTPGESAAAADDIAFANRLSKAFKSVASSLEPSVIHITAMNKVRQISYDIFGRPIAQGPIRMQPSSLGSGVIIRDDGYAVTNNHVVRGADALKVKLNDGTEYDAKLIGRDEVTDLAVLKIQGKAGKSSLFHAADFGDSESLDVGEWVIAIGSPFGLSNTVTAGIVSAKGRSVTPRETGRAQEDFIQTDAAINPGNSGGPLLNLRGQIMGINSAIASRTGGYEGIGFAIPGNTAKAVVENIIANGRVVRGWMGADYGEADPSELLGHQQGVVITRVQPDGPAQAAGLKEGDVILKFKGAAATESRLATAIAISNPGTKAEVEILRDGILKTVTLTLADQSAIDGNVTVDSIGLTVRTLSREQARKLGDESVKGVIVIKVDPKGRAAMANPSAFEEGDIIVSVKRDEVKDANEFARLAESLDYNRGASFNVIRDKQRGSLLIRD